MNTDKIRELLKKAARVLERTANDTLDGRNTAIDIREFLAELDKAPKVLTDEKIQAADQRVFMLIQRLVDAIAYSRKHGPPVSLSNSHWDIALHNALYEAAEAGFKPSEP